MDTIFDDIERALEAGIFYAAIAIALSLPDICSCLQHPVGHVKGSNKAGYVKWFQSNLADAYPELTGADLYSLRSGVVHTGRFGAGQFARVLFTVPNPQQNVFHRNRISDTLNLDSSTFCRDMIKAARDWLAKNAKDQNVQRNLERVVRFRPLGLSVVS